MKFSRIKFQWGTVRTTPGDWYLGLFGLYRRRSGRGLGLAVSLRGALLWGLLLAVVAYFAGAGYFWWKLDRRRFNFVRYSDVLLYPLSGEKRREVRELQGRALIAEGLADLQAQQWHRALMNMRIGLDRYPRDLNARLKVAQLFLAFRVRAKAQETLMQGLEQGWPGRTYLQSAIEIAASGEDYEMVIAICDRALGLFDPARHATAERRWLVEQRIRALLSEKRADDALDYLDEHAVGIDDGVLSELRLLAILQSGRAADAVAFAEEWRARAGDRSVVLRLLARGYREAGRLGDMTAVLEKLRTSDRTDPRAQVFAMVQYFLAGKPEEGRAMLDDYIFRFGGTEANYVIAVEPLAEINRPDEVGMLIAAAAERGMRDPRLLAARLQVLVAGRRWAEATRQIADIRGVLGGGAAARAPMLDLMQYLVAAAADPSDGAQSSLTDFVRARQLSMQSYRQCVEVLRGAGRIETARRIVVFASGVYPKNRYLEETQAALDAEIEARRIAAEASRPVSAPSAVFASAASFGVELDRVLGEEGVGAGLALFRELRQARPAWMQAEQESLAWRELELRAEGDDLAALQGAVRLYLTNDRQRIRNVVTLATRLHGAGRAQEARMLLQEILRRVPGEPAAAGLLVRWFPAREEAEAPAP